MGRTCASRLLVAAAVLLVWAEPGSASLLDSPWPGFLHDSSHTCRSPLPGPSGGSVGWVCAVGSPGTASPAVGLGVIYAVGGGNLVAVTESGAVAWSAPCGSTGQSSPCIASDGTIYVGSTDGYLYAINPDGSQKWRRAIQGGTQASPTVGPDGTVHIGSSQGKFYAYRPDGTTKYTAFAAGGAIASSAALASDGTAYFGCDDGYLYAVKSTGTQKWRFATNPLSQIKGSPAVGPDGTIYFGASNGYFYAVWPSGTQRWRCIAGGGIVSSPAISADGCIHFGCRDGYLYCLWPNGSLRWRVRTAGYVDSSPAIDSNGRIYVGSYDGYVYAVNAGGFVEWSTRVASAVTASPAVGANGTLYVVTRDGDLCSFSTDSTPPPAPVVIDDGEFSTSPSVLHAAWSCSDPESGISRYEYAIRNSAGTDVVPFTDAGTAIEVTRTDLQLVGGETYRFVVRAVNGVGLVSEKGVSDGIKVDLTPPVVTDLHVSVSLLDMRVHVAAADADSGVSQVQCALLTSPQLPDTPNWIGGPSGEDIVIPGPFDLAGVYYVAARALDGAGLWSAPIVSGALRVDNTPPSTPVVTDDGTYSSSSSSLRASWASEDAESGIGHYSYCVGTSAGASNIVPWTDTTETSKTLAGLSLTNGATYFFSVRATNRAGLVSAVGSSDGITVDVTPPTQPAVTDDGEVTSSPDCIRVMVSSTDPESGISGYSYCIGTAPGLSDVLPYTSAPNQTFITACGLALRENTRYYVTVRATNGAGIQGVPGSSDGIEYRPGVCVWRKFRSDARNTGCALVQAPMTGRLHWRVQTQGYIESSAAVGSDGTVYVGSADGKLYAISSVGTVRWTYDTGTCVDSSPAVGSDGCIYVGSYDGMHCVRPDGTLKWKYATGSMVWSSPALAADGTIYFGCQDHRFVALNPDGTMKWTYTAGGAVWSSPAIADDGSVYFCSGDGKLYSLTSRGWFRWAFQTGSAADSSPAIGDDGSVYFGSGDGHLYAVNPDGSLKWKAQLGQLVDSSPAVTSDGRVYVGTGGAGYAGSLWAFTTAGAKLWQMSVSGGVRSSPAVDESGDVCFGSANGKLYLVNRDGALLWSYTTGDSILASPAFGAGGAIIVGSDDGGIYCFRDQGAMDITAPTIPVVHAAQQFVAPEGPIAVSWSSSDPESGIRGYAYAIGTQPGEADVVAWTEVGTASSISRSNLPLVPGRSYYVSVRATNHAMLVSPVGVSEAITVVAATAANTIGGAKKLLVGTQVNLPGKVVTAVFDDCVFVEEPNRSSAIRCVIAHPGVLQPGAVVAVTGRVGARYGETVLTDVVITPSGFDGLVRAIGTPCETFLKVGLDTMGLLVRVAGRVTRVGSGYFVLHDGCHALAPRGGGMGIEVQVPAGATLPAVDTYVSVEGIVCRELVGSRTATVIRMLPGTQVRVF